MYLGHPIVYEKTFPFLVNPETGSRLYLDGYIEKFNLAIEYDGIQHYFYTPFFHKTIDDFIYRQKLDKLKETILLENNIKLIRFRFDEPISIENIKRKLKELIII